MLCNPHQPYLWRIVTAVVYAQPTANIQHAYATCATQLVNFLRQLPHSLDTCTAPHRHTPSRLCLSNTGRGQWHTWHQCAVPRSSHQSFELMQVCAFGGPHSSRACSCRLLQPTAKPNVDGESLDCTSQAICMMQRKALDCACIC